MRVLLVMSCLALAACGENGAVPVKDPSSQDPTKVDPSSVGGTTTEPSAPGSGLKPTSEAPGSPADGGHCKSGRPDVTADSLDKCLASCRGQDDTVPPGSRCISPAASCASQCNAKFKN